MAEGRYSKILKPYELFIKKCGYEVFYNGNNADESTVFMVLYIPNRDDPNNFSLAFFEIYGGGLTLEDFIQRVMIDKDNDNFARDVVNRVKGCTVSKTDAVFCLLTSGKYTIDQIYGGGQLHLTKTMLKEISDWINFKGGRNPLTPAQVRARMNS